MDPFVGEIRMFGGTFAPQGWALCDGQLLAVSSNDALFSLFGTIYGGDGRTTFGLPDLRGRVPVHAGTGGGMTPRTIGAKGGAEKVSLNANTAPTHTHVWQTTSSTGVDLNPDQKRLAESTTAIFETTMPDSDMSGAMVAAAGGSLAHDNVMPFLCVQFIVSLYGIYPSRH